MSDMPGVAGLEHPDKKILDTLKAYCRIPSITNTAGEALVPGFFRQHLAHLPYFRRNPDHLDSWKIENDSLNREVSWAMIRGGTERTVVLIHHCDVVVTDNFGPLRDLALDPDSLEAALKADPGLLDAGARQDLFSGQWLFGRGTADMKGGGAIQLSLFEAYARLDPENLKALPTLVLLALPDEENLSAGMRSALGLLCHLKKNHGLTYDLMINSEPHQRLTPEKGLISQGSIGKLNLFVYVRGVMAHVGKVLEGINPTGLMARIVAATDLNDTFMDQTEHEISIPPTWIFLKDLKKQYDVSFPEACYGLFNILNFHTGPGEVMEKMAEICRETLVQYLAEINQKRDMVAQKTGMHLPPFSREPRVLRFGELAAATPGPPNPLGLAEELSFRTAGIFPEEPLFIVGLCPPYYPGVANADQKTLHQKVTAFTRDRFGQDYDNQAYYTGISDLSYAMAHGNLEKLDAAMADMAGQDYHIPFDQIEEVSMNCINIGPWGKDFHKPSERVFKQDLLYRTPMLIDHIIRNYNK